MADLPLKPRNNLGQSSEPSVPELITVDRKPLTYRDTIVRLTQDLTLAKAENVKLRNENKIINEELAKVQVSNKSLNGRVKQLEELYLNVTIDMRRQNDQDSKLRQSELFQQVESYVRGSIAAVTTKLKQQKMGLGVNQTLQSFFEELININLQSVQTAAKNKIRANSPSRQSVARSRLVQARGRNPEENLTNSQLGYESTSAAFRSEQSPSKGPTNAVYQSVIDRLNRNDRRNNLLSGFKTEVVNRSSDSRLVGSSLTPSKRRRIFAE